MLTPVIFLMAIAFSNGYQPKIIGGHDTVIEKYPYQVNDTADRTILSRATLVAT